MKNISPLVQTKTGVLALAISTVLVGGTVVLGVQFVTQQIQIAQAKQRQELLQEINKLIADATAKYFAVGVSIDSYKDLKAKHEALLSLAELSGQQNIVQSAANVKRLVQETQQGVEQNIVETKTAQETLQKFVATHQDFMKSVSPQMQAAVDSILGMDIQRDAQNQIAQQPQQQPSFFPF